MSDAPGRTPPSNPTDLGTTSLGVEKVASVGVSGGKQAERTEVFSRHVSSASQLTTLVEALSLQGMLIDLEAEPDATLVHRQPIEVSGELALEPASEIGQLFALALPKMMGAGSGDLSDSDIWELMAGSSLKSAPSIVMSLTHAETGKRFMMVLDPKNVRADDIEDLEGDMTVFGILDKLLPEGGSLSLQRYLLPKINRAARRALSGANLQELLDSSRELTGRSLSMSDLEFTGPGALLSVVAIYP
jgi:hypothetical protein